MIRELQGFMLIAIKKQGEVWNIQQNHFCLGNQQDRFLKRGDLITIMCCCTRGPAFLLIYIEVKSEAAQHLYQFLRSMKGDISVKFQQRSCLMMVLYTKQC